MTTPKPLSPDEVDRIIHEPARLKILALLYVLESADYTFVMQQTGMTWGNISSHMNKLEGAGYVELIKEFVDRKPHTMLKITGVGREAFQGYRQQMMNLLGDLPE